MAAVEAEVPALREELTVRERGAERAVELVRAGEQHVRGWVGGAVPMEHVREGDAVAEVHTPHLVCASTRASAPLERAIAREHTDVSSCVTATDALEAHAAKGLW
eukprot:3783111-Pyramimonas_sp.AAC.1